MTLTYWKDYNGVTAEQSQLLQKELGEPDFFVERCNTANPDVPKHRSISGTVLMNYVDDETARSIETQMEEDIQNGQGENESSDEELQDIVDEMERSAETNEWDNPSEALEHYANKIRTRLP